MEPLKTLTAVAAPLIRANVDTDAIIPSREMKTVSKVGLADGLFAGWRYTEVGGRDPNPGFVLNDSRYRGARILLSGPNFGCGSSREHAVWAMAEYGFRAILADSFSPIFQGNCVRNGVAPIELPGEVIARIAAEVEVAPQERQVTVDLERCEVVAPDGGVTPFRMAGEAREMLLEGLDAIDLTLKRRAEIQRFRQADRARRPWIYL
jgi:3-isopropylmalate/(R)-2-methylmalate dehydratase small subunit